MTFPEVFVDFSLSHIIRMFREVIKFVKFCRARVRGGSMAHSSRPTEGTVVYLEYLRSRTICLRSARSLLLLGTGLAAYLVVDLIIMQFLLELP